MSLTAQPTARAAQRLQGRHVLGLFLAFFAAVFLVNGAMIYAAMSTHTGLVASEPYRKGLHYNDRIAQDERQARLGWVETLEAERAGRVRLTLADSGGRAISGLTVTCVLGRPTTNRHDIKIALTETAPGSYEAEAGQLAAGGWLVAVEARRVSGAEPLYRARRRLWLKP